MAKGAADDVRHGVLGRLRARSEERADRAADRAVDRQLRARLTQQWAEGRAARSRPERQPERPVTTGPSNTTRAQVPWGVDLAAAWGWRFVVICAAGVIILYLIQLFAVVILPLVIALFIAALAAPLVSLLSRRMPRKVAALVTVVAGLGVIALLLTFVGRQVAEGIGDLSGQVVSGLGQIRGWLRTGPLHASDTQINSFITRAQELVSSRGEDLVASATEVGTAVGHIVAGFFIIVFATYFFLADGALIWAWVVRLFPRAARLRADSSGRVAWRSLTQFVRATVLVAATDALGVVIFALALGLPFVGAIGVLVFLGAFVPLVGATASGVVAILVALVAQGPVAALVMLGGVILVQQLEAHVLQPFLMGRFVSVHPLAVIVAIAMGIIVAGIAGGLIAVPLAATLNAVVTHLATFSNPGDDAREATERDPGFAFSDAVEDREATGGLAGATDEDAVVGADESGERLVPGPVTDPDPDPA